MNKAARKSPQCPKKVQVIANGQGHTQSVRLPESKDRVVQTIIDPEVSGMIPSYQHLTGQLQSLQNNGEKAYIILTANKIGATDNLNGNYKYYVTSAQEIEKHGLHRAHVQKSANKARESARCTPQSVSHEPAPSGLILKIA
jgi:hypothetical protein